MTSKPQSVLDEAKARIAHIDRYVSDPRLREDGELLARLVEQLRIVQGNFHDAEKARIELRDENERLLEQYEGMKARFDSYAPGTVEGQVRAAWDLADHLGQSPVDSIPSIVWLERYINGLKEQLQAAQRKVEAYDRARARVKIEGATRAEYILLAESALEQFEALQAKYDALSAYRARIEGREPNPASRRT